MIARIWKGDTRAADAERYASYLRETGTAEAAGTAGNRGVLVLRRTEGERAGFVFVSLWDSLEAVRAFAGDEVERARYYPEDEAYLLGLAPMVEHYEVVDARGLGEGRGS